jgi:hypothetical protein
MTLMYPADGETFGALVRRVLNGLAPRVRARVQVVTGGERSGLVVPADATPVTPPSAVEEPTAVQKATAPRRRGATTKESS